MKKPHLCYPDHSGGVRYPTYGVRIKQEIKQLLERYHFRLVCLHHIDFQNQVWLLRTGSYTWVAFAVLEHDLIMLDADYLCSAEQTVVNFVCLHEIGHLVLRSQNEAKVSQWAARRAKRLGWPVPTYAADGRINSDKK